MSANNETIAGLFELAITAEEVAQEFYLRLTDWFSHLPGVADFWYEMARDEAIHADHLKTIRATLTPEQLQAPVDPAIWWKAGMIRGLSTEDSLRSVETLDDAYQTAHELENSEVNTVFELLTTEYVDSSSKKKFIISQLNEHTAKLMHFTETLACCRPFRIVLPPWTR